MVPAQAYFTQPRVKYALSATGGDLAPRALPLRSCNNPVQCRQLDEVGARSVPLV